MIDFVVSRDIEKEMLHRYTMPLRTKADGLQRKWMQLLSRGGNFIFSSPANIYQLKINNRNTRKWCKICSKLTIKTPERRHSFWCPLLLILNIFHTFFWWFYCLLWACICLLGCVHASCFWWKTVGKMLWK